MPYINEKKREIYRSIIDEAVAALYESDINCNDVRGDLNYLCFAIIRGYQKRVEAEGHKFGYSDRSNMIAALRDCASEYERRFMGPYEDLAIEKNGDV